MPRIEDTSLQAPPEVRNEAYTSNSIEPSREASPTHIYDQYDRGNGEVNFRVLPRIPAMNTVPVSVPTVPVGTSRSDENSIIQKNKSNKFLIIGLFMITNIGPSFELFSYPLNLGVIISSLIAVGLLAWALVVTLKQPSAVPVEVSTFEEVCVKKSHQEENDLLVFLEANFKITRPIQPVNTVQSIDDEHVSGVICRHIQSNQEFSGKSFE